LIYAWYSKTLTTLLVNALRLLMQCTATSYPYHGPVTPTFRSTG